MATVPLVKITPTTDNLRKVRDGLVGIRKAPG